MEFRHLGRSGLKVSEITFGNWVTHASQVDDVTAHATIHAALDAGITTFDTADVYAGTRAEEVMGAALHGQRREGVEILTKVYWPTGPGVNDRGLSRKHVMESCHASLRAFDDLVRQGKVLYVGVSEWTAAQIREAVRMAGEMGLDRLVSNQPQYSMLWRVIEAEVVPASAELGVGQIVWSPMAQGVLSGKYVAGQALPAVSRASSPGEGANMISRWMRDDVLTAVQRLLPIAADLGLTPAQLAIAWVLANPNVSAAIVGASRPEQIIENVRASGVSLADDVLAAIDSALSDVITRDPALTVSPDPRP
jgi:aryl-alcohol dehydrogenase-like predicted oxidoreductase